MNSIKSSKPKENTKNKSIDFWVLTGRERSVGNNVDWMFESVLVAQTLYSRESKVWLNTISKRSTA